MEAEWCRDTVREAVSRYGKPEIINTDQGSQFTSEIFTSYLLENEITISMDGKGRATDNIFIERLWRTVKYEDIHIKAYETGIELYKGVRDYFKYYNFERRHSSINDSFPAEVYKVA